ncbi:MAG: nicotinate phosphoribosyltransferase [Deltaproteobacteria bacterium]|nr:nicotinate phosphoribosyltransferase [Deltaproteobacteria bacterium]
MYQLTMGFGFWKTGHADDEVVFNLYFRKNPFKGGYAVAAGLDTAIDLVKNFRITDKNVAYLSTLKGNDGRPLFDRGYLQTLRTMRFNCDIDAVPEGTVVFPNEPLLRIRGPLLQVQLLETVLLNILNFQTLIATKASRVVQSAKGDPVLDFGLRRAQGFDGSLSASRACYLAGAAGTSNVAAGELFGIPVKGTHAHSWVMFHPTEVEAFENYSRVMPNNSVFLVDTYDTLNGVKNAITVAKRLRKRGHEALGIRLDSGDLAKLSKKSRTMLDEAGFPQAFVSASNDLDEHEIAALKKRGAKVNVWGVGTKMITAFDQPALGGVYKLAAVRRPDGTWERKIKLSETPEKTSTPGILQVRRFMKDGKFLGDMIWDLLSPPKDQGRMVSYADASRVTRFAGATHQDLLVPVFRRGKNAARFVMRQLPLEQERAYCRTQLEALRPGVKRLTKPTPYKVGMELGLNQVRQELMANARSTQGASSPRTPRRVK